MDLKIETDSCYDRMYGPYVLFNDYSQIILCMTNACLFFLYSSDLKCTVDPINHGSFYPAFPWPFIGLHENIHFQLPSFLVIQQS